MNDYFTTLIRNTISTPIDEEISIGFFDQSRLNKSNHESNSYGMDLSLDRKSKKVCDTLNEYLLVMAQNTDQSFGVDENVVLS